MEINISKKGGAAVILLKGRLDAVTAPDLDKKIEGLLSEGESVIIINFSGVDYISSAGLRSILAAAKQLKDTGGKILLSEVAGAVKDVFEISGFYSIFQIFGTEADALSQIR